jgi:hypothetical protein
MTSYSTPPPPRSRPDPSPISYALPHVDPPSRTTYRPTAEQLARDEALKRYNRRSVTIPAAIISLIALGLFVLLLVLAFGLSQTGAARQFIAGMSALTIILISIPLIFFMSVLPIAYAAWWFNRRQQRKLYPETGPMAYRGRLQTLLWQLESYLIQGQRYVERGSDTVINPIINSHVRWAKAEGFMRGLKTNFTRSEPNDPNNNTSAGN